MGGSFLRTPAGRPVIPCFAMTDVEEAAPPVIRKPGNMALWAAMRAADGNGVSNSSARVDVGALTNDLRSYDGRCAHNHVNCSTLHDTRAMTGLEDFSKEERIEVVRKEEVEVRRKGVRSAPKRGVAVTPEMWRILEEAQERVRKGEVRFSNRK